MTPLGLFLVGSMLLGAGCFVIGYVGASLWERYHGK